MPSNQVSITEPAPIYGMNTVDDARSLKPGQCVRLLNALPGNPPQIINGSTGAAIAGTTDYRFIPPGISFEYSGSIYAIVWVYDSDSGTYKLCSINTETKVLTEFGTSQFSANEVVMFDFINLHSCIYAISETADFWNGDDALLESKVIDGPSTIRAMCFSEAAAITSVTAVSGSVFTDGKYVQYAFQYVRKIDAASFTAGTPIGGMILPPALPGVVPIVCTSFVPGAMIGPEDTANRKTVGFTGSNLGSSINIDVAGDHAFAISQGATHIRVSRSLEQDSAELAASATKFFLFDLPLLGTGTTTFSDTVTNASLSGETNQLITGYTSAPEASFVEYVKGRLFLMAESGIVYYSESVGGDGGTSLDSAQANPQAWSSLFNPISYFIDCDKADGQIAMGMKRLGDDLFMWKERKIFALFGGSPADAPISSVSMTIGCAFPYTITKCELGSYYGNCILFLSNEGPMIMQEGGRLRPFSDFKIRELWPTLSDDLYSELDLDYDWIVHNCSAAYYKNVWWIMYRKKDGTSKMFGYYFNPDPSQPSGPFEYSFAEM